MKTPDQPEEPAEHAEQAPASKQEKRDKMIDAQEDAAKLREEEGGYQ